MAAINRSSERGFRCSAKVVDDLSSLTGLRLALGALEGSQVTEIARAANIVQVAFNKAGVVHRLHVQCALRVIRGQQILVGSTDMNYAEDPKADPDAAYETQATKYDYFARRLTAIFEASEYRVLSTELSDTGSFAIESTDFFRFEAIPICSGPIEAWRLFEVGADEHYVYPESSLYDGYPNYASSDWP
jgi:hypothetical protein